MDKKNDCWGIDVGANALKAIRLARNGAGVSVADYAVVPFKKVLTTPDTNVGEQVQLALDEFLSTHDTTHSAIVVSVPGHMAFARFAKLPPVDPKKISDIVKYEAVQQIPFPIEQVEWDYQVFAQADTPDMEVGIFAITKEKIADFLGNYRQVGLNVDGVTLSPLSVYNAIAYDFDLGADSPGLVMMDIGTTSTDVIIFEADNIWLRTLPIGGNNFTEALVRAFKLSFPKAERLKREAGTSKYARQIFTAMRPVFADLVQELQRSLGYYQSLNRDAKLEKLVGLGSTFRLPGMQKFLKQQLQMEVVRPDAFNRISVEGKRAAEFADHTINMATAYGNALLGLDLGRVEANILPRQQVRQRLWRGKQPWFAASAALMVLPVALMYLNVLKMGADYTAAKRATDESYRQIVPDAKEHVKAWNEISEEQDSRQRIENLSRVLDYRDVWPKLLQDLNMAAAALKPQAETMEADYAALAGIPRAERRRIYIESIEAAYRCVLPQDEEEDGASSNDGAGRDYSKWFATKPAEEDEDEEDYEDDDDSYGSSYGRAAMATVEKVPPSFEVTIRGTTPNRAAAEFLSDHFIRWLELNTNRSDRAYRVEIPERPFVVWPAP